MDDRRIMVQPGAAIRWSARLMGTGFVLTGVALLVWVPDPARWGFGLLSLAGAAIIVLLGSPATAAVDEGRLHLRHLWHRRDIDPAEIAAVRSWAHGQIGDGRLVVTLSDGRVQQIGGSLGARPEAIARFVDALIELAPTAALDIDLSHFPKPSSRRRGCGHYGPPAPEPEPTPTATQVEAELRQRHDEGRAQLAHLRAELEKIQAAKRS